MKYHDFVDEPHERIELTYKNYKDVLSSREIHKNIIETVKQYALDTQIFKDEFVAEKSYSIAHRLYFNEFNTINLNENGDVLAIILATYCLRYNIEEFLNKKGK